MLYRATLTAADAQHAAQHVHATDAKEAADPPPPNPKSGDTKTAIARSAIAMKAFGAGEGAGEADPWRVFHLARMDTASPTADTSSRGPRVHTVPSLPRHSVPSAH
jgi:hypothetical protein